MVTYLTLDSSIIVASLRKQEEKHIVCKRLLERVKNGEFVALEPYMVLVEVVAAIRRRTGSESLAEIVKHGLEDISSIISMDMISIRADDAAKIAKQTGVRGMDAIVIQIAKEFGSPLVSLDMEMIERSKYIITTANIEDVVKL
ncbi:MAG: type II toxin-antitoxin system VapC family toxin [Euryarchaeota archaeon]|nr:type II toxin-antitoxin system VapC family toxin [Euryarchaeota archaeon]